MTTATELMMREEGRADARVRARYDQFMRSPARQAIIDAVVNHMAIFPTAYLIRPGAIGEPCSIEAVYPPEHAQLVEFANEKIRMLAEAYGLSVAKESVT